MARLDRLGPAREVAQVGSVIGWPTQRCKPPRNSSWKPIFCSSRASRLLLMDSHQKWITNWTENRNVRRQLEISASCRCVNRFTEDHDDPHIEPLGPQPRLPRF